MSLLLLLMLLACGSQATHFLGTVMTYYPKQTNTDGSVTVVIRYKLNFHRCTDGDTWRCLSGNCGNPSSLVLNEVDKESSGEWCQREGIMTRQVPSNAPFELWLDRGNWINNIVNGIINWRAVTLVELRNRSDTGRANRSPQTTILPAVRVPSNCRRDFNLLAFDPDGDEVRCRYGNPTLSECNPCTPPSVLHLSSSCSLSFSSMRSKNEGPYAVQLVMEDFPRQTITLTQTGGVQVITTNSPLSKLPVQFVLRVDPVVPSCTEGLYLPKFLPPTPANRAQLYNPVYQSLEISISAEANVSLISELLFSGPYNMIKTTSGSGRFTLRWTPSEDEDGESHPVCFVVQAVHNSYKYHSELRCLIVSVGNEPPSITTAAPLTPTTGPTTSPTTPTKPESDHFVVGLRVRITSLSALSDDDLRTAVIQQLKDELVRRGIPPSSVLTFVRRV
ncbi:uncharacterized protein LOC119481308 [Sebastes umbrosus]|uniref:uncharacterized protein LOC119481308 n=1 Tax=Sebastes umbrosus TaxID=72105 RepID=UPI00189DCBA4|nr:uncharacterized protein LOC119481308 [Sebastes umbrosus]